MVVVIVVCYAIYHFSHVVVPSTSSAICIVEVAQRQVVESIIIVPIVRLAGIVRSICIWGFFNDCVIIRFHAHHGGVGLLSLLPFRKQDEGLKLFLVEFRGTCCRFRVIFRVTRTGSLCSEFLDYDTLVCVMTVRLMVRAPFFGLVTGFLGVFRKRTRGIGLTVRFTSFTRNWCDVRITRDMRRSRRTAR